MATVSNGAKAAVPKQVTIRDVAPKTPQFFHDDYVWFYNFGAFHVSFAVAAWLGYTGRTTLLACVAPVFVIGYYVVLGRFLSLPPPEWKKEIVLITGGGTGIGAELAVRLANRSKVVVLTNVPPSYPEDTPNLHTYICDVSDRAAIAAAAAKIREEVGDPTIVVNNAGVVKGKLLLDLTAEDIQSTFNVNAIAPFFIAQEFLPSMIMKRKGHIVNVASVLGLVSAAQMTDYNAAKAALVSMHDSLRRELEYRYKTPEIRTTLVLPGHIHTGMFKDTLMPVGWLQKLLPSLLPSEVVEEIIVALEGGSGALQNTVVRIPTFTHSARIIGPFAAIAPSPLLRITDWLSAQHFAMKLLGPQPDAGERIQAERKLKEA